MEIHFLQFGNFPTISVDGTSQFSNKENLFLDHLAVLCPIVERQEKEIRFCF